MSAIGKIFIVLNLVFSLVIVGAAASYLSKADDWKTNFDELKATYDTEKESWSQDLSDERARAETLRTEVDDKQSKIEDLEVANENLNASNQRKDLDNQQLRSSVDQIKNTLADFRQNMNDLNNRNSALTDDNAQLRTASLDALEKQKQAEADLQRKVGDLARATDRVGDLEVAVAQIEEEKGHLDSLLKIAQSKGFDISSLVAMKKIDATVVEVDNELGFVVLSVGKDDEVSKGWTFQIYRDDQYLGEVEIDEVYEKFSAAKIKFAKDDALFQIHDAATTVL